MFCQLYVSRDTVRRAKAQRITCYATSRGGPREPQPGDFVVLLAENRVSMSRKQTGDWVLARVNGAKPVIIDDREDLMLTLERMVAHTVGEGVTSWLSNCLK